MTWRRSKSSPQRRSYKTSENYLQRRQLYGRLGGRSRKRGLLNLTSTVEAIPYLIAKKNVELFKTHGIFSEVESYARYGIKIEGFCKIVNIEALTMIDMARRNIAPAVSSYCSELASAALAKKRAGSQYKGGKRRFVQNFRSCGSI